MNSSKNEIFIAIFLGILVGLTSVFTLYFVFKRKSIDSFKPSAFTVDVQKTEKLAKSQIQEAFDLELESPASEIISRVPNYKINGKTNKSALLVIQTDDETKLIKPDELGNFTFTMPLNNDINQFIITAIYNKQEKTIERIIYYEKQ